MTFCSNFCGRFRSFFYVIGEFVRHQFLVYPSRLFLFFLLFYFLVWFLLPILVQPNVRPDTLEQFFIGKEWVISTTKHPTLPACMLEVCFMLTGGAVWSTYLVSQISVLVILCCIWRLSREFLSLQLSFFVVLVSCNYRYLNIGSVYFHQSIGILPFWALAVLCFYFAVKCGQWRYWILTGLMLGCGLMCKYPMGLLALTVFLFVCCFAELRRRYYLKLFVVSLIAFIIFLPHVYWNINNGFPTLRFATTVGKASSVWYCHLTYPLIFTLSQIGMLVPVFISIFPLIDFHKLLLRAKVRLGFVSPNYSQIDKSVVDDGGKESAAVTDSKCLCGCQENSCAETEWKRYFIPFIVFVPMLLQMLYIGFFGNLMRPGLGTHLWLYLPLFLVCCLSNSANEKSGFNKSLRNTLIIIFLTMVFFAGYWVIDPLIGKRPNKTLIPGRALAEVVERTWHSRYSCPIPYLAGEWNLTGNVALYGKDRPTVFAFYGGGEMFETDDESKTFSPWVKKSDLYKRGAVILWQIRDPKEPIPPALYKHFPNAEPIKDVISLRYQTVRNFPPLNVGIAIIPPPKDQR